MCSVFSDKHRRNSASASYHLVAPALVPSLFLPVLTSPVDVVGADAAVFTDAISADGEFVGAVHVAAVSSLR